jgi:signal transduction histidine kinase
MFLQANLFKTDIIVAIVAATILFLLLTTFIILFILKYQKRRQQHLLEVQNLEHQFSQTLLSSQIEIQEQTLRNISQELHDNISQKLGLAKLQLNQLRTMQPGADVGPTKAVISEAIADIRSLSKSMHPDRIANIPLKESIEHEINLLRHASPATFTCHIEADPESLSADQRIILFRIFQELLNNALKYAKASTIEVLLTTNDNITLSVIDNGAGLPPDYQKGIGHTSIQNRVTLLKGSFHLGSNAGKGTVAKVEIPMR